MDDKEPQVSSTKPLEGNKVEVVPGSMDPSVGQAGQSRYQAEDSLNGEPARPRDANSCHECLSALTHRLAQPMTALRGGIEVGLMGKRSAAEYRCVLEQSLQLADSMAELIISLRDLGESNAPGGGCRRVNLDEMAAEVLTEVEGLAQSRNLGLKLKVVGIPRVSASPDRLREALAGLLVWVIQNSSGGVIVMEISSARGEVEVVLSPSRLDLQYLQIKALEDIAPPGVLFSHATKNGGMGWIINQRLLNGVGGRLEFLTEGLGAGGIRVRFAAVAGS